MEEWLSHVLLTATWCWSGNNHEHNDRDGMLYNEGQSWLERKHVMVRVVGYVLEFAFCSVETVICCWQVTTTHRMTECYTMRGRNGLSEVISWAALSGMFEHA